MKATKKPSVVMIDNYDSFTYNLVQYLQELGADVDVIRNDGATVAEVLAKKPAGIIISPGPSDPDHAGITLELIKTAFKAKIPLFGVCLGHQAIGQAFGGKVLRAPRAVHGKCSAISHKGKGVFQDLPSPMEATRYHSLIVERKSLPRELEVTAETDDGLIMGLATRDLTIQGVQFHPESVLTVHGKQLLENFVRSL